MIVSCSGAEYSRPRSSYSTDPSADGSSITTTIIPSNVFPNSQNPHLFLQPSADVLNEAATCLHYKHRPIVYGIPYSCDLLKVLATEAEARIHAARETALAAESVLEARQDEARNLRTSHEKAMAELAAEMADKRRRGKEGVAARLEVQ